MFNDQFKRCLSFLMALVMVLSLTPVTVLATETEEAAELEGGTEVSESTSTGTEEVSTGTSKPTPELKTNSAITQAQAKIDSVLVKYLGSTNLSYEEMEAIVVEMDWETVQTARNELSELPNSEPFLQLTEDELISLCNSNPGIFDFYDLLEENAGNVSFLVTQSGTTYVQIGDAAQAIKVEFNSTKSGYGLETQSGTTLTFSARSAIFNGGTTTITIYNNTDNDATLSFDYSASGSGLSSLTVDGTSSTSGSFSKLLASQAFITVTLKGTSSPGQDDPTVTLSNLNLVAAAANSNVTFEYDSTKGSIKVAGTEDTDGSATAENVTVTDGVAVEAVAKSGVTFLGWINIENGSIISTETSFTLKPGADMTVKAVFVTTVSDTAWFLVNNSYLFNDLNAAAGMTGAVTVVLLNNGTLPAGDYTIPAGVTLLIPFDSANTLYTTKPASTSTTYTKPTAYRTLTMASGANITVNGAISLSGKYKSGSGGTTNTGAPSGPTSFVKMQEGSSITLNSGGALYCYGFITGSGSVTAKSGSTVYELFQFQDWRGGDETTGMKNGVFPISQYYVQNVEVPLELQAGSTCYGFTSVTVSILGEQSASVKVFGPSGSMFNITSGSLTKRYDGATDRVIYEIDGTIDLANVKISMGIYNVDSADYDLAINNNITVQINGGSTVNITKDVALLPGTEIIIEQGATCALGSGVNLYVYDVDEWGGYCGTYDAQYIAVTYAPGRTGSRAALDDAKILIKGIADASAGYVYTTAGGANICGEEGGVIKVNPGTQTVTYQYKDQANEYPEIPITSAQLKHGDGSYADTSAEAATYHYAHGVWHKTKEKPVITQVAAQAASCDSVGWNAYEYCSTCDYTTYDEIAALGHSYETVVTAPTCTEAGYTTYTCSACGDSYVDDEVAALGHSYDEGVYTAPADYTVNGCTTYTCTACSDSYTEDLDLFNIYATNIRAGDGLDIYFYVKVSDLEDTDYVAKITRTKAGVMDSTVDVPFSEWTAYGTDYMRFSYSGIAAKEMTDEIYVSIYDGDGIQVCAVQVESVARYALRTLGTEKTELNTALVDMLNYGAAAQNSFSYNTADLANAGLSDTQTGFATESTTYTNAGLSQGEGLAAASVSAKNKLMLTFYYYTDLETNGYTAYISYTDHYGAEHTPTVSTFRRGTLSETNEAGETVSTTVYGVDVTGLAIADGRQPITCVIKDGNENVISTSICSIENYIAATIAQANKNSTTPDPVYELLMKFVDSAYAYFH